jgi:hypothetical protein
LRITSLHCVSDGNCDAKPLQTDKYRHEENASLRGAIDPVGLAVVR